MKKFAAICLSLLTLAASPASADALDLGGYQGMDGAITVGNGGEVVEPYFASKALLVAREGGLNIDSAAYDWIAFAIRMQRPDGLFERYCFERSTLAWNACGPTDADDAALALWLELLHVMKSPNDWPEDWAQSALNAEAQLESLKNPQTGLYHISATNPVSLLMDNVEVYYAFHIISEQAAKRGNVVTKTTYRKKARDLAEAMATTFWNEAKGNWNITTQARDANEFYPDIVAQIYPLMYGVPLPTRDNSRAAFKKWMGQHRDLWMNSVHEDFPWGLVAIAAIQKGDLSNANCWQERVEPFRYSNKWNVLEEASFQRVQRALGTSVYAKNIPCVEVQP